MQFDHIVMQDSVAYLFHHCVLEVYVSFFWTVTRPLLQPGMPNIKIWIANSAMNTHTELNNSEVEKFWARLASFGQ